ncbi:MAG: hypothetical protein ACT4PI_17410 [Actinomycetota bacterium]
MTTEFLRRTPPGEVLQWVADSVGPGARVTAMRAMPSSWLANHAVDVVDRRGATHELVLRRWARPGWELGDPEMTAAHEAGVLELLAASAVPAPELAAADADADACDVPALLVTRLAGEPPPPRPSDLSSCVTGCSGGPRVHRPGYRRRTPPTHPRRSLCSRRRPATAPGRCLLENAGQQSLPHDNASRAPHRSAPGPLGPPGRDPGRRPEQPRRGCEQGLAR